MRATSLCSESKRLGELLLGLLPDEAMQFLERHVEACEICQRLLPTLKAEDTLVQAMRGNAAIVPERPELTVIENLMQQLERLEPIDPAIRASFRGATPRDPCATRGPQPSDYGSKQSSRRMVSAAMQTSSAPDSFPGYETLEELGRGGMGIVYKARQTSLNRLVALKVLKAGPGARVEQLRRFRIEAAAIARLQHPHIVQIYEVGESNGQPFYSLELINGTSLASKLAGVPQPPRQAATLVETLARATHAAHQRGIIHRDLKPANVLLTADEIPKITDFGLAKLLDDHSWSTDSGVIMGSPPYMAPEQAAGKTRDFGPHTDVYGLGAILYETLTGRPPFRGATEMETLDQVRHEDPVPPSRLQPKVPRDLETICLKCLEKEIHNRYASAEALANDLHSFLANEPIQARPVRPWERGFKWAKRKPAIAALIAVSVLALLSFVVGGMLYTSQRALAAEQELNDRKRRDEVQQLVIEGQKAAANRDWHQAKLFLTSALAKAGQDEHLSELREQASGLLRQTDQELENVDGQRKVVEKRQNFFRKRDDALFHATLATGEGDATNLKATREAAWAALGLFGISLDAQEPLLLEASLSTDIVDACYELMLILAGVEDQSKQALLVLDRAAKLGCSQHPTQAYHLRRARYLEKLGNQVASENERKDAAARPPSTALDHYLVGDEHYKQDKVEDAVRDFENALALQPDHFWARYFLSVSYLRSQRPNEARVCLTACLRDRPDFIWIYLLRGFAHGQLREFQAAESDFQKALELSPNTDAGHVLYANRGVLWLQQGQHEKAIADLKRAIQMKPDEYQAYVTLAHIYQEQKKWDDSKKELDRAIGLRPDLALLYRLRARIHLVSQNRNLVEALEDCQRAIETEKRRNGVSSALAKDHAERGRILHYMERFKEAIGAFDLALTIDASYADAYRWRADAQFKLEEYQECERSYDEYLRRGGNPVMEVYRTRGLARAQVGKYPDALQDYTRALDMKTDDAFTRAARGWAYLASQAHQLALLDFRESIRLNPENGEAYNGRGYARVKLGQYREAIADAEAALLRGQKSSRLFYDAARIYAQAVSKIEADARQPDQRALARHCQDRAVTLIRESLLALSPKEQQVLWQERILSDSALIPIYGSTEFLRMAAEYGHSTK